MRKREYYNYAAAKLKPCGAKTGNGWEKNGLFMVLVVYYLLQCEIDPINVNLHIMKARIYYFLSFINYN